MEQNFLLPLPTEIRQLIFKGLDDAALRSLRATGTQLFNEVIYNNFRINRAREGILPIIVDSLIRYPYPINLSFTANTRPKITTLYELTRLTNLKSLSIGALDSEISSWMPLTTLTNLECFSTPRSKPIQLLDGFLNTKELELWIPDIEEIQQYESIVSKMTALESINMKGIATNLSIHIDLLAPIHNIGQITSISVEYGFNGLDVGLFGGSHNGLTKLTALKKLEWISNKGYPPIEKLTTLEVLTMQNFPSLDRISRCKILTKLELIPTQVYSYEHLTKLQECNRLKTLILRNFNVDNDSWQFLTALTALEEISLKISYRHSNNSGDILSYINSTRLTKLIIQGLKYTPAANFISRLTKLESLQICECKGSQEQLTKLGNLTKLIIQPPYADQSRIDFIFTITALKNLSFFLGELNIDENASLKALTNLESIRFNDFHDNLYNSMNYLTKLRKFKYFLGARNIFMKNADPLTNLTNLHTLHYCGHNITLLTRLVNLEWLKVETNLALDIHENELKGYFPKIDTLELKSYFTPRM